MQVEEDGDEIFIPMDKVRCCVVGFQDGASIYSKLAPVERFGVKYMCCEICGGSYGEAPKEKL